MNTRACAKPTVTLTTVESFVTVDGAGDIIATPTLASHAGVWPQTVTLTMGSGINAIVKVINFTLTVENTVENTLENTVENTLPDFRSVWLPD